MWPAQQKPVMFTLQLNFNFITPAYKYTQWLPIPSVSSVPSPVYPVLNVNWSAFLKGILPTP